MDPGQSSSQGQGPPQGHGQPQGQGQAKSKAQLKAERRALQEAQRAAKQSKSAAQGKSGKKTTATQDLGCKTEAGSQKAKSETPQIGAPRRVPNYVQVDDDRVMKKMNKKLEKQHIPQRTIAQRKVGLFNHLHQYERELSLTQAISFAHGGIHPAVLRLGLQYAEGVISGSNARCIALLAALKQVIADYSTPAHKEMSRDLDARIKPYISFLSQCRQLSVSMGSAIKHIKRHINNLPTNIEDSKAKEMLYECIDDFIRAKITVAAQGISKEACQKISSGDVIMVYACSSLILRVLCDAHKTGKSFTVIVVDSRPKLEGRHMLRRLVNAGLKCSYVLINAASYVMKEVDKVFLGAHALLANGCVMSRVGSSQVALLAKAYNVPVLVCCETYKFCERVQTDSFVFNELGDPDDLVRVSNTEGLLCDWRDLQSLSLLHLVYDVTPSQLITMVITELGKMPCTSVPVVLRITNTTE